MKTIKYLTVFCMMICMIMQLNINVSANENNICYVAHRGYTKYAPENSIPAFEAAGKEGFQAVECDIHETAKDKKGKRRFVIMHDQTLNRMCGLSGKNVYQKKLTYQKIRSKYHIKTGNNIESYTKKQLRIPSLEEYLSICKRYHMKPVIEIKQKMKKDTIKRLYQSLKYEDFIAYGGWNHTCSDHKLTEQTETIMAYFPGAIRKDWIVDQKAHDEQVVIGYQCSCGDIHKVENN